MKSISIFNMTKNESAWIGFHVMSVKDFVSEFVYYDSSTDGTTEILEYLRDKKGINIRLFKNRDVKNLQDDYVDLSNEIMRQCKSDYLWYCHPDMILDPSSINKTSGRAYCYSVAMRSYAGDPLGKVFEFEKGRAKAWKSIMQNGFGLHYYGHYGAHNEDMYFGQITGNSHELFSDFKSYPYAIKDSGFLMHHFSDLRTPKRRLSRMISCLKNQNHPEERAQMLAKVHPRVTLQENNDVFPGFKLTEVTDLPEVFGRYVGEFAQILGKKPEEFMYIPTKEAVNV